MMEPRGLNNEVCLPSCSTKELTVSSPFSILDFVLIALSIGSFVADVGTDAIVIVQYYRQNHLIWMLLTLSLVCIPSVIVQVFSLRWYVMDGAATNVLWVVHIFQLAIFNRYIQLLRRGFRVRKSKSSSEFKKFNQEQSDICMLRLFESFMESAPQLVLQLYIMVNTEEWNIWTGLSAIASVFSLSWGISAYSKAMRTVRPEKKRLTWCGLILQASWRIGTVSSRVIAMVLFAVAYGPWLILVIFLHWLCMTIWVISQETDFCTTWWEERLYNCIVGIIYCFCFFNLKEGRSRLRMTMFYSLTVAQNIGFALAYFFSDGSENSHYKEIALALVPTGMAVGLSSMLLYYRFFHPGGPIYFCEALRKKNCVDERDKPDIKLTSPLHCNLKTCRKSNFSARKNEFIDANLSSNSLNEKNTQCNQVKDLNESLLSVKSNRTCLSDLHRSHSQNCGANSHVFNSNIVCFDSNSLRVKKDSIMSGSQANHYKNVNYNFCTAVAFGQQSSKFHCSCLVLLNHECAENEIGVKVKKMSGSSYSLPELVSKTNFDDSEIKLEQQLPDLISSRPGCVSDVSVHLIHNNQVWRHNPDNVSPISGAKNNLEPITDFSVYHCEHDNDKETLLGSRYLKQDDSSAEKFSDSLLDLKPGADYHPVILEEHIIRLEITTANTQLGKLKTFDMHSIYEDMCAEMASVEIG